MQLEFLNLLRIHLQSPWGWHGLMLWQLLPHLLPQAIVTSLARLKEALEQAFRRYFGV